MPKTSIDGTFLPIPHNPASELIDIIINEAEYSPSAQPLKQAELRGRRNGLTTLEHYPGNGGTIDIFGLSEREWKQHLIELEAEMENLS